jgi:ABC-type nitrate/sulfonate/bicarbonate transport system permease component
MKRVNQERALAVLSPVAALIVWQLASNAGLVNQRYVPSPIAIAVAGWDLALSGELALHIGASLRRLVIGFVLGAVPGVFVGMVMGLNRWVRAALDPLVAALYPIPKIALLPLLMLVFGLGDGSKVVVVAMSVLFLTIINTTVGVVQLDKIYFDVARNYGTPWPKLFLRVAHHPGGPAHQPRRLPGGAGGRRVRRLTVRHRLPDLVVLADVDGRADVRWHHCDHHPGRAFDAFPPRMRAASDTVAP